MVMETNIIKYNDICSKYGFLYMKYVGEKICSKTACFYYKSKAYQKKRYAQKLLVIATNLFSISKKRYAKICLNVCNIPKAYQKKIC